MKNFTEIIIIMLGYPLSLGFSIVGIIGFIKVEKEFKGLNYGISDMERKKRLLYATCIFIGYIIQTITTLILILVLSDIV